ncbi:2-iminobutanoate/2-iminopropanoate deaminase-like [Aethina tumida]|uniref:2-iminobutanoate/2-iminopropanoate deaminase-like n=1 Tax=Aethina tumida TaxID=116153 RepID=UPI00096AE385|nr:2-iminobutanoate/2-iminopropanoate deaminase-like [Aethina tumida]
MAAAIRRIICTSKAPLPGASPYNQAVVWNNTVFASGVVGMDKDTMKIVPGGAANEARQALKSIGHILDAAGSSYAKVIKSTVMLNDINDFTAVNEVYKEFFKKDYPARSTYQVGKLPLGASVEIEVIAAVGDVTNATSKI